MAISTPVPLPPRPVVPRPPPHRVRTLLVAVVLAVLVLLAVLFATGAFGPAAPASTTPSSPYRTFAQAESSAAGAVGGSGSGPWSPVLAIGLFLADNVTVDSGNISQISGLASCSVTDTPGLPAEFVVGGTPASAPSGTAAYWAVGFVNGTGSLRIAQVDDGSASVIATVGGSNCTGIFRAFVPLDSVPVVDSPVIAANFSAAGAGTWLAQHPAANGTWILEPGYSLGIVSSAPSWQVAYTTCSAAAVTNTTGAEFNATFASATGALTHPAETGSVACTVPSGVSLGVPALLPEELARKA
ncbi:MAG TPA: hypothetical protein VMG99_06320 [Thermoplasmata archaeon]|jgi:hypothetical protein|nr:hypothetical protein [Thermoplasmata archaeon]